MCDIKWWLAGYNCQQCHVAVICLAAGGDKDNPHQYPGWQKSTRRRENAGHSGSCHQKQTKKKKQGAKFVRSHCVTASLT